MEETCFSDDNEVLERWRENATTEGSELMGHIAEAADADGHLREEELIAQQIREDIEKSPA